MPGDYDAETEALGFTAAAYYKFSKNFNMRPIMVRVLVWSAYSFFAGFMCYYIPFYAYGLGQANIQGKTEDLWTCSLASIMAISLMHHV